MSHVHEFDSWLFPVAFMLQEEADLLETESPGTGQIRLNAGVKKDSKVKLLSLLCANFLVFCLDKVCRGRYEPQITKESCSVLLVEPR